MLSASQGSSFAGFTIECVALSALETMDAGRTGTLVDRTDYRHCHIFYLVCSASSALNPIANCTRSFIDKENRD